MQKYLNKKINYTMLIFFAYILFVWIITRTIELSGMLLGFLGVPLIVIIPILIGNVIASIIQTGSNIYKCDVCKYIFSFLYGISVMILLLLFMDMLSIFSIELYSSIIILISFYSIRISHPTVKSDDFEGHLKELIIVLFIGLIPPIFVSYYSPYPFINSLDIFNHLHYSQIILENSVVLILNSYLQTFHIMIALALYFSNAYEDPLAIFWAIRFLLYPLYSIGVYIFTFSIVKNKFVSILSATIGVWILISVGGDHGLYNFTPRMLIYVLIPYILYLINKFFEKVHEKITIDKVGLILASLTLFNMVIFTSIYASKFIYPLPIIILLIIIFFFTATILYFNDDYMKYMLYFLPIFLANLLIHNLMGFVLNILLIPYILAVYFKDKKRLMVPLLFMSIVTFLLVISQKNEVISFQVIELINTQAKHNFLYMYRGVTNALPYFIRILLILGICISMKYHKIVPSTLVLLTISILYFSPILNIERVALYSIPLISLISAYIIYKSIKISSRTNQYRSIRIILLLLLIPLIILSLFASYSNTIEFSMNIKSTDGYYSHFTQYEYDLGRWVKQNTEKDTLIISDRSTEFIIGGLANRDIVIARGKDRRFDEVTVIADIMLDSDAESAHKKIKEISNYGNFTSYTYTYKQEEIKKHNQTLIIINGRTVNVLKAYQKNGALSARHAGTPVNFETFDGFSKFFNEEFFELIYSIPGNIYVFEVK